MIEIVNITKHFEDICALNKVSASFPEGEISVILGTSGSGKSTLVRIIGGIVRPDGGVVIIDDMPVYDNEIIGRRIFLIPEEPYCPRYMSTCELVGFYAGKYDGYDEDRLQTLCDTCRVPIKTPIRKLEKNKGLLAHLAIAVSMNVKYLICDDIFSSMDEESRKLAAGMINTAVKEWDITPVIALPDEKLLPDISGKTYELETVCLS